MGFDIDTENDFGYSKNNILDKTDYKIVSNDNDNNFSINDIIVCFSNGLKWHIVSLDIMITYPVL